MTAHRKDTPRSAATASRFAQTVGELAAAVRRRDGALPSAGSPDPADVRLARWLAKRRWEAGRGLLSDDRVRLLDRAVPRWRESTHSRAGFEAALAECADWLRSRGHLPRSAGGGPTETRLGRWIVARRYDAGIGRLSLGHAERLDADLDGWRVASAPSRR
ncbi:helicase associated domain-containing protein [Microbacterium dextranolyticum]|uniref:Helicase-associated domain-containing protein n=1 Tax=Microbacterium dextranolyticum TaxID=36806 RepID=A0A9W6HNZ9_9MICO|nr:helicase associated domain-containing protein [Microbacterium dextranolyticum]MBM7462426.1 hypothetical protein [Microbacterium dextranolyticum]GLJ96741.1 hypothetical protein GCM10017591_28040 [Microbacterium dextranolyticum]